MSNVRKKAPKDLIIEKKKLEKDVKDLKSALELHHDLKSASDNTVHGLLRNEIGGSRWQYGGQGKLTTFKSGIDLKGQVDASPERCKSKMSRPSSSSLSKTISPNKTIEQLEKLKSEIDEQRAILEEKFHLSERIQKDIRHDRKLRTKTTQRPGSVKIDSKSDNSVTPKEEKLDESLFDTDYLEIEEKKDKVLEKISSKVISRNSKVSVNGVRNKSSAKKPEIGFGSRIEKKPEKVKPVKHSKIRNFRRAEPATVINDLTKPAIANDDTRNIETPDNNCGTQKYLSEPQDEVMGLSKTLSKIKIDHEKEKENRRLQESKQTSECDSQNVVEEQKLGEILRNDSSDQILNGENTSIDIPCVNLLPKSNSENQNEHEIIKQSGPQTDTDNIHDVSTSDYSSDIELIPDKSVSIPISQKSAFLPVSVPLPTSSITTQVQISNAFEIKENFGEPEQKQVKADKFVKAWIRKLGIEDVQKTAMIFAKNNIGMAVMKYVTEEQICEMGFSSLAVMNKILEGIQTLKLTSSSKTGIHNPNPDTIQHSEIDTQTLSGNPEKRESRRAKRNNETVKPRDSKHKPTQLRNRSSSRGRMNTDKSEDKKAVFSRPRSSSRSREIARQKAEAAVSAAAQKKIDKEREMQKRKKEKEKIIQKQKQHRDMLAAKHVEREIQKSAITERTSEEPDIFTTECEDFGSETTGRSTALENYLISSRLMTPESSQRSKLKSSDRCNDTVEESDISPERVRSMIKTLLSSDHLQDHMTLNLVKNLQKQLEDVEDKIKQKQEDLNSSARAAELVVSGENIEQTQSPVKIAAVKDSNSTPHPSPQTDEDFRCDSEIGIWDPSKAPNIVSELLQTGVMTEKEETTESTNTSTTATLNTDVNRPKSSKSGVASMSMSKRALLDEIRKEKDEHRKQIRHLQSELSRLQHKDPVKQSEIPVEDILYEEKDLLGEGAFSKVYRGYYQAAEVAVKKLKVPLNAQDKNYFAAEVSLLRDLRHPRVVMLLGVCTDTKLPLMVLEYMCNGCLFNILHDPTRAPLDHVEFYQISRDIAAGMVYLHNQRQPVLHLDLKSMNVLIGTGNRAKIADFGFSKLNKQIQGSPAWMAPELLLNGDVTVKADVYSFGMILWEMLTRKQPYEGCSMFQILERVRLNKRPDIPDHCPVELRELIDKCWHHNPAKRLVFKEILNIMEDLTFPKEWRELFAQAGVPNLALNDIQSTRNIISLVNSTLESARLQNIVQDYQLFVSEDTTVSSQSSISVDSLDDLEVVSSEDSFEKIIVDTDATESSLLTLETHDEHSNYSNPTPRKLTKDKNQRQHPVESELRKSKEAWSLSEELKLDLPLSPDIPSTQPTSNHPVKQQPSFTHSAAPQPSVNHSVKPQKSLNHRIKPQPSLSHPVKPQKSLNHPIKPQPSFNHPVAPQPPPPPPIIVPAPPFVGPVCSTTLTSSKLRINQKQSIHKELKKEMKKPKDKKSAAISKSPLGIKSTSQPRMDLDVSALKEQRKSLKPTNKPHSNQLQNLSRVPREAITSIAEILKKAMEERRFSMGEVNTSVDADNWSYQSQISQ